MQALKLFGLIFVLHFTVGLNTTSVTPARPTSSYTALSTGVGLSVHNITNATNATQSQNETAFDLIAKANNESGEKLPVHEFDMRFPNPKLDLGDGNGSILHAPIRDRSSLWPNGIVPYVLDVVIRRQAWFVKLVRGAMDEWESKTCIRFRQKDRYDINFIEIQNGIGCNSDVGMIGGRQTVSLGSGCTHHSVTLHELGHVIGFWHEQNRPDRDKYIRIVKKNIVRKYEFAFNKYSTYKIDSLGVPYDYKSIMHYGKTAFSKNRKPTIVSLNGNVRDFGNHRLSVLDIMQANKLYRCPDKSKLYPSFPADFRLSHKRLLRHECIALRQPYDRSRRGTQYLCIKSGKRKVTIRWSYRGTIPGLVCTKITGPRRSRYYGWLDNHICVPRKSPYHFRWSVGSRIGGYKCMEWVNSYARHWGRGNYLCAKNDDKPVDGNWSPWAMWSQCTKKCGRGYQKRKRDCSNPAPKNGGRSCVGHSYETRNCNEQTCQELPSWPEDFRYQFYGITPYSSTCIRTYNRAQYFHWANYYFCSRPDRRDINMKWSDDGPIPNMRCLRITEPKESASSGWDNNYLCVPKYSPYHFKWSHSGPVFGLKCVQWYAKGGKQGWNDNYLCAKPFRPRGTKVVKPKINGGWSLWGAWSKCSKTCDSGFEVRRRSCDNPAPLNGGLPCNGTREDRRTCKIQDCPMVCGKSLTGIRGTFRSPKMDIKQTSCTWIISVPAGQKIKLSFSYLNLGGRGVDCRTDYVEIRDGRQATAPFLRKFCSSKRPSPVWSSSNAMWIKLTTRNNIREPGLVATWQSFPIPSVPPQIRENCGGILTGDHGEITSPTHASSRRYPRNTNCIWIIQVGIHKSLKLRFLKFDIEYSSSCDYDYVEIRDGSSPRSPLLGTFCGTSLPKAITAFTNGLWIKFRSDGSTTRAGFKAIFYTEDRTTKKNGTCNKKWRHFVSEDGVEYCYLLRRKKVVWRQARDDCRRRKSDLLSIATKEEQWFVRNELMAETKYYELWTGYNDLRKEGTWTWSDQTKVDFNNWAGGDPNNGGTWKNEDCGVLKPDGKWNDFPCNYRFMYICKKGIN